MDNARLLFKYTQKAVKIPTPKVSRHATATICLGGSNSCTRSCCKSFQQPATAPELQQESYHLQQHQHSSGQKCGTAAKRVNNNNTVQP